MCDRLGPRASACASLAPPSAPLCPSQHTVGSVPHLTSPSLAPPSTLSFRIHSLALASRAVFAVCVRTLIVGAIVAIGYHIINSCEIDPFYPFYLRQLDIAELSNIRPPKRVGVSTQSKVPRKQVSLHLRSGHGSPSASASSQMMRMATRWSVPSSAIEHSRREGVSCPGRPANGNRSCGDVPHLVCLCASPVRPERARDARDPKGRACMVMGSSIRIQYPNTGYKQVQVCVS